MEVCILPWIRILSSELLGHDLSLSQGTNPGAEKYDLVEPLSAVISALFLERTIEYNPN